MTQLISETILEIEDHMKVIQQHVRFNAILATDERFLIGKDDGLPWHCKADLQRFKQLTMGSLLVVGYKTFAGFVKNWPTQTILPGRDIAVVYSPRPRGMEGVEAGKNEILQLAKSYGKSFDGKVLPIADCTRLIGNERIGTAAVAGSIFTCASPGQTIYVAGGAYMYELLYDYVSTWEMTVVDVPNLPQGQGTWTHLYGRAKKLLNSGGETVVSMRAEGCTFYTIKM